MTQASPEGGPSYEMVENKVEELLDEVRNNPVAHLSDMGFDISGYVDVDSLAGDVIDTDGAGPSLAGYDGEESEAQINGTWYFVYRVE